MDEANTSNKREYAGINPIIFYCLKKGIEAEGGKIKGTMEISTHGFTFKFDYNWDGEDKLSVVCTHKSIFVSYNKIWEFMDEGVKHCGGHVA